MSRVARVINGWGAHINGTIYGLTVKNFIYVVYILAKEYLGGEIQLKADNIFLLLKHSALE